MGHLPAPREIASSSDSPRRSREIKPGTDQTGIKALDASRPFYYLPLMSLITTSRELAEVCGRMAAHPFVTVDTEFLRETTFWPKLCVVQLATSEEAVAIDALADGIDLSPLFQLMANAKVVKVFHAA